MLDAVRDTGGLIGAWRWFLGDWLLENGFYRPISSCSIALDYTLYEEAAWGFRLTNWLLMILTALGAFFLVRAYARLVQYPSPDWLALGVATAISLQQTGLIAQLGGWSAWWFVAAATLLTGSRNGLWFPRFFQKDKKSSQPDQSPNIVELEPPTVTNHRWVALLIAVGALFWGFDRLMETHYMRLILWVPSRTALLGTAFSVWAVYWLLQGVSTRCGRWFGLGGVFYLLALGSYEQPITLVPIVGALALWRRREWGAWGWKACGTVALASMLILALRVSLLPTEPTRYQQQQLRSSLTGPISTYLTELIPPAGQWQYWASIGVNLEVLLVDKRGWDNLVGALLYLGVLGAIGRNRALLGGAFVWHALTFLPMAFLHFFEHYMYLPQLGKTLFDVGLIASGAQIMTLCPKWVKTTP